MRTSAAVKSWILRTATFFFRIASSMEFDSDSVVSPQGSSVITSRFLSSFSMTARTFTLPRPSSYSETSMMPPSWKSGKSWNFFF